MHIFSPCSSFKHKLMARAAVTYNGMYGIYSFTLMHVSASFTLKSDEKL